MTTVRASADADALQRLVESLPGILAGTAPDPWGIRRKVLDRANAVLLERVRQAFVAKSKGLRGDDGIRWAPRKSGKGDLLRKSGKLLASIVPLPADLGLEAAAGYAGFHHRGTRTIPARPFWPEPDGLPEAWAEAVLDAVREELERIMGRMAQGGRP